MTRPPWRTVPWNRAEGTGTICAPGSASRSQAHRGKVNSGVPLALPVRSQEICVRPFWPEPALRWPTGFRAYPAETNVSVAPQGGLVAGSKVFSYLVVPDSVGTFVLPGVRYPYYDVATGGYAVARTPPLALAVLPGTEPRAARALPPLLSSDVAPWQDAQSSW